jgi:cytochrome c oxidase accessory protein FixG
MVAGREKIYVRATVGRYANWRWACVWITQVVYFGLPWLNWNGRQIVLFDLAARKFYVFGTVLWPQDFVYLAAVLILCALALFLSSALVGRAWCGFACPHTVYTEVFMWIERKIEGGRGARIRLDREPLSAAKFRKKAFKHGAWALLALWTGVTLAGYFTPIKLLVRELAALALGPWQLFWIAAYGLLTYGNAGWMREQICRYICPYARFQSVMLDGATLVIAYDGARGEPRGIRKRAAKNGSQAHGTTAARQGDCIDCTLCIQVCPTGSDIRDGLQYDCMACAACIDACDLVMDKIGAPRGLIRYAPQDDGINADADGLGQRRWRPRVLVYAAALAAMVAGVGLSLAVRVPLKLDVMRDRGAPAAGDGGALENVYRLHIINTDERTHRYAISVAGIDTIALAGPDRVALAATAARVVPVRVVLAGGKAKAGSHQIVFTVQDLDDGALAVSEKAAFLVSAM